jgi:hypothetical protein
LGFFSFVPPREPGLVDAGSAVRVFDWPAAAFPREVTPGSYCWRIEADQAGSNSDARGGWQTITVSR